MNRNIIKIITLVLITILSLWAIFYFYNIKSICTKELLNKALDKEEYQKIITCANKDVPDANTMLGVLYVKGQGAPQDYKKAMNFYQKAAKKEDSLAMIKIGDLYAIGLGVLQDYNQAILWYKKAIDENDVNSPEAMYSLSVAYGNKTFNSEDKINDINSSIEWLQKAANNNHIRAIRSLAQNYKIGYRFAIDYGKTMEWYQKAADLGDPLSHIYIGDLYAEGLGVQQNYEQAYLWYQKAADLGDPEAIELIKPNPAPFGLELTKATIDDFKKLFPNHRKHSNNVISGTSTVFYVKPEHVRLEDVIDEVIFVFNHNNILDAVLIGMKRSKVEEIRSSLNSKYGKPRVDDWYNVGQSIIRFYDYHINFSVYCTDSRPMFSSITLIYKTKAFDTLIRKYAEKKEKEEDLHKSKQRDLLSP